MSVDTNISRFQSKFPTEFSHEVLRKLGEQETSLILEKLDSCFNSVDALNDFARDELNLSQDAFDASRLATGDLAKFKIAVMDKLAEARAKNHGFLKSQTGICAFLRNLFMSFFMHISASFHAEKLFEQNDVTTEAARDMLKKFSTLSNADVVDLDFPDEPNIIDAEPDLPATPPESPAATEEAQQSRINHDIIGQLQVIDTPRDGSCMLWSVLTGLSQEDKMSIRDGQDAISDENVLRARDVTIPKLRQVISLEL